MPVITFIKDVTLSTEAYGSGPHYRAGYCVDASDGFAQHQVKAGNAVYGVPDKTQDAPAAPVEPQVTPDLPPLPRKKRSRWSPMAD